MSGRDTASLETGAGAKAANSSVDNLSMVIRELDKKTQGEYSLRLLLAAHSPDQLRDTAPAVHRMFVDARAQVMEETLGNLCAFYAMFPGNVSSMFSRCGCRKNIMRGSLPCSRRISDIRTRKTSMRNI